MPSLKTILTRPNVIIQRSKEKEQLGICTVSSHFREEWPLPKAIIPWPDFNLDVLESLFNRDLCKKLNDSNVNDGHWGYIRDAIDTINQEEQLCGIISSNNQVILQHVLDESSEELVGERLRIKKGAGQMILADRDRSKTDFYSTSSLNNDWCILPGEVKCRWKFGSEQLSSLLYRNGAIKNGCNKAKAMKPLRQLLHYCILSHARFGYLITDNEMMVVRLSCLKPLEISADDYVHVQKYVAGNMVVEYQSIPWGHSTYEESPLTINLALWYLHILAANDGRLQPAYRLPLQEEHRLNAEQRAPLRAEHICFPAKDPLEFDSDYNPEEGHHSSDSSLSVTHDNLQDLDSGKVNGHYSPRQSVRQAVKRSLRDNILAPRHTNDRIGKSSSNGNSKTHRIPSSKLRHVWTASQGSQKGSQSSQ